MVVGCGIGGIHGQMWWNDATMQDVEKRVKCGATLCKMCDARCGVMHNVANIWCDLKCGVEYMEYNLM